MDLPNSPVKYAEHRCYFHFTDEEKEASERFRDLFGLHSNVGQGVTRKNSSRNLRNHWSQGVKEVVGVYGVSLRCNNWQVGFKT